MGHGALYVCTSHHRGSDEGARVAVQSVASAAVRLTLGEVYVTSKNLGGAVDSAEVIAIES